MYCLGGMPAAVLEFVESKNLEEVRNIQKQILFDYQRDFSKHAPSQEVPRINMVWDSIPSQLAKENKKFIFGALKKGARASEFELAIQWLIDAGLIYQVNRISTPSVPLKFYEEMSVFKLSDARRDEYDGRNLHNRNQPDFPALPHDGET